MADIELKTLLGRLNRTCTRALEAAAGWCVSRGNYEIAVEHLLHELVQQGGSDVPLITAHYEIDAATLKRSLLDTGLAERELGFKAHVQIPEGFKLTYDALVAESGRS